MLCVVRMTRQPAWRNMTGSSEGRDITALLQAWSAGNEQALPELINRVYDQLAEIDQRRSRIVELRFLGGLTVEETAVVLKVSERTVLREWNLAKAWLYQEIVENS